MMKKNFIILATALFPIALFSQIGINTNNPKATFDINGEASNTAKLDGIIPPRITGAQLRAKTYTAEQTGAMVYVTSADNAPAGQTINVTRSGYFLFDGTLWQTVSSQPINLPNGTGTIISINGEQQIAQEISVRMSTDWNIGSATGNLIINNITTKIIDNYNSFTGTATANSFTVNANGTYLITMNFSVQAPSSYVGNLYYGVYNNTSNVWVSQLLETLQLGTGGVAGAVNNLSFTVAMELTAGDVYSFRISKDQSAALTMRGQLTGNPSTFFSLKRLK